MSSGTHRYFLGTIAANVITFTDLANNTANLPEGEGEEFPEFGNVRVIAGLNEALVYVTRPNGQVQFHRLVVDATSVSLVHYTPISADYSFAWDRDHQGRFVLQSATGLSNLTFTGTANYAINQVLSNDSTYVNYSISRQDLYQSIYPFQWLQGDYNGDGKTDLGFFHLREPKWYFANTTGTVPDLINKVDNGIGGEYEFTYANSTAFDNTGGDGIPDLPTSYKVCTQEIIRDGFGGEYINNYQYKNGFAFSAFINGRKETDFYGFTNFSSFDGLGSETANIYNTQLFGTDPLVDGPDFYLKNRALAGALAETRFNGWDLNEYSKSKNTYSVRAIQEPGAAKPSYYVTTDRVEKFIRGVATETMDTATTLTPNAYQTLRISETKTDLYSDAARASETVESEIEFQTVVTTNQQRPIKQISFKNSPNAVTVFTSYDGNGNVAQTIQRYTGSGLTTVADRVIEYQYDGFGNRVAQDNKSDTPSRRTEFQYDSTLQQFVAAERLIGDAITLTETIDIDYASAFGHPKVVYDSNNFRRIYTYDSFGRMIKVEADVPSGGGTAVATLSEYQYSADGSDVYTSPLSAKTAQYSGTAASDVYTRVFKDGVGREVHTIQSALFAGGMRYTKTGKKVYDPLGRIVRQSQPDWAADNEIDTFVQHSAERNPTLTDYDASGRVRKITSPKATPTEAETSITHTYNDPWEAIETHSIGQSKKTIRNARGHEVWVEDFATGVNARMFYCYDLAGNRVKRSDSSSAAPQAGDCSIPGSAFSGPDTSGRNVSYFKYDGMGQNVTTSDPDTGVTQYTYTAFGQVQTKTDARNFQTAYFYDRLGRVKQKILPNGEGQVNMTYDVMGGVANGKGRLVAMEDNDQFMTYSYDALGRHAVETRQLRATSGGPLTSAIYETRMRYDLLDRSTEIDYPTDPNSNTALRLCYAYNAFGLVSSAKINMTQSGSGCADKVIIDNVQYNEFRQIDSMSRGNGITSSFTYDNKRRVKTLTYGNSSADLSRTDYTYDIHNGITKKVTTPFNDALSLQNYSVDVDYAYDGLNRLSEAKGQTIAISGAHTPKKFSHVYQYSPIGNITQKQFKDYDTGAATDIWNYTYNNHKVTSVTTSRYGGTRFNLTYDNVGNTTNRTDLAPEQKPHEAVAPPPGPLVHLQGYDSRNRIRTVTNGSTNEVVGQNFFDDYGFRVRHIQKHRDTNAGPNIDRVYEVESANKYFAVERQKDLSGNVINNTTYSINNIYFDGVRVASVIPTGQARYFLTDQVDSVNVVMNDNGKPITRHEYLPYGDTWFTDGDLNYAPKFNSQELDKESNLYFFNARHYDSELSRFVSADTAIDGNNAFASWNRYMYVHGNPVMYKDPTGNQALPGGKWRDYGGGGRSGRGRGRTYSAEEIAESGSYKTELKIEGVGNAEVVPKHPGLSTYKYRPGMKTQQGSRQKAVERAWAEEKDLLETTGQGSRDWTPKQAKELLETGKVEGFEGHHSTNVANPKHGEALKGDPRNIRFLSEQEHLQSKQGHRGNFKNNTEGRLIDRKETKRQHILRNLPAGGGCPKNGPCPTMD